MGFSNNRKNTQMMVDFLRGKKIASGIRTQMVVESLKMTEWINDVIIIKNGYYTSYFLEESYRMLVPIIYTKGYLIRINLRINLLRYRI